MDKSKKVYYWVKYGAYSGYPDRLIETNSNVQRSGQADWELVSAERAAIIRAWLKKNGRI